MAEGGGSMAAAMRQRRRARRGSGDASAAPAPADNEWVLSQGLPQKAAVAVREAGAAQPALGRAATEEPAGTDAVVPLALVSARPHAEWKPPLLTHVKAPNGQIKAVPREEWAARPYTRDTDGGETDPTMADTLRARREARKAAALANATAEAADRLNRREMEERLEVLEAEEAALQARMAADKEALREAQALSASAAKARQPLSEMPQSMKRMGDMHKDGKKDLARVLKTAEKEGTMLRRRAHEMPAEVDNRPSLAVEVQQRQAATAAKRVEKRGGQLDGSGWRQDALVLKHNKFIAAAAAGKRPGVDAGDRGGRKSSWLRWEGAGKGGRALAVQQRFARKRPTLQVLARMRRESMAKARAEIGMAAKPRRRKGQKGPSQRERLSLKTSAGYRAGYHGALPFAQTSSCARRFPRLTQLRAARTLREGRQPFRHHTVGRRPPAECPQPQGPGGAPADGHQARRRRKSHDHPWNLG